MPNKNYIKGRRKEYSIVNNAKAEGKIAFRSAGSHSPIDVITIDVKEKVIELIQSKAGEFSTANKEKILLENSSLNGTFLVRFKVVWSHRFQESESFRQE